MERTRSLGAPLAFSLPVLFSDTNAGKYKSRVAASQEYVSARRARRRPARLDTRLRETIGG